MAMKPQADAKTKVVHIPCSLLVTVDKATSKAIKVEGDLSRPYTKGYLRGKVNHYLDYVYNEQRVMFPQRRVGPKGPGAKFEHISWDDALTTITDRCKAVIAECATEAIALPLFWHIRRNGLRGSARQNRSTVLTRPAA